MFHSSVILINQSFVSAENIKDMLGSFELFRVSVDLNDWWKASEPFRNKSSMMKDWHGIINELKKAVNGGFVRYFWLYYVEM